MRLKTLLLCGLTTALPLTLATAALAEPDITGMWSVYQPEGKVHQPPAKFTPQAAAINAEDQKINTASKRLIGEAHTKCWPTGMPGLMQPPFGIEFLQTKGRVTILSEVSNLPRTIYLDEKAHPDTLIPGWNGHSIGHWEGNVLMVDTIGFNGRNHNVSEKTHITEKIYLDKEGYLVDELTQEDPLTYLEPRKTTYRYRKAEGQEASEVMEYVCEVDPANLVAFEQEQKAAGRKSDFDPQWAAYGFSHPAEDAPQKQAAK
ncbi:MAG: hypothetical protein WDN45_00390 [Caulobacteraceae bacterium]